MAERDSSAGLPVPEQFTDRDLRGARFHEVLLTGASFEQVRLNDAQFRMVRFDGTAFQNISWRGVTMKSVELVDVEISGDVWNVVVNGVDIGPLINAELNRRDPERHLIWPDDAEGATLAGLRAGWEVVSGRWARTIERVRAMPEGSEHRSINGEWSLVQTLRHVSYALAAWAERVAMGRERPFVPTDLPWDEGPASAWPEGAVGRDVEVPLDEAVAQWERRRDTVRDLLAGLSDEEYRTRRVEATSPGYPQVEDFPLREALFVAVSEAWEHHRFATRDLDILQAEVDRAGAAT